MNKLALVVVLLSTLSQGAWADGTSSFTDRAQVVSSTPIYQQVNEPRRECWTETVGGGYDNNGSSGSRGYGGAILGGLVGGLLGNTVGQGNGRTAAAAVGAVTGAMVGDKISNNSNSQNGYNQPRQVERCSNRDEYRQIISGYNVVYRYQGRTLSAVMPQDPGKYVNVSVNVALTNNQVNNQHDERYDRDAMYY